MKTTYLKFFLLALLPLFFCLFSCKNTTTQDTPETRIAEEKPQLVVSFTLSNVEDDINGTQSTIGVNLNAKNIEIAKTTNCNIIEKEEYDSKDIPLDATWACSCWWAGAGENFYAIKSATKVEIYKKEMYEEMKTEDEKWVLFKTLE